MANKTPDTTTPEPTEPERAPETETQPEAEAPAVQAPTVRIGDDVFYVLADGPHLGEQRPAKVVAITTYANGAYTVNLQVFTDGPNDGERYRAGVYWATSVPYSQDNTTHTWRHAD